MITHPNQKVLTVVKQPMRGNFIQINNDDILIASVWLSPSAFKLWIMFNFHKNGYKFAFSPEAYSRVMKMSLSTVRKAIAELIEVGYVWLSKPGSNEYGFTPTVSTPNFYEDNKQDLEKLRSYIGG